MRQARKRTPAECIGCIISAAMGATGTTADKLADAASVHANTVRKDLRDPDGMTMQRLWIYFTVLGVPVDEGLNAFADSFARSLVARKE